MGIRNLLEHQLLTLPGDPPESHERPNLQIPKKFTSTLIYRPQNPTRILIIYRPQKPTNTLIYRSQKPTRTLINYIPQNPTSTRI